MNPCCKFPAHELVCKDCVSKIFRDNVELINDKRRQLYERSLKLDHKITQNAKILAKARFVRLLRNNIRECRKAIAACKKKAQLENEEVKVLRQSLKSRRDRLDQTRSYLSKIQVLIGENGDSNSIFETLETKVMDYSKRVSLQRKKLVTQLVDLFPIGFDSENETIANLPLPSNLRLLSDQHQDIRMASLTILVHLLMIVSSYLSLVLPFKMLFIDSQPAICRWGQGEPITLLTGTGLTLETGIIMLRKNMEALCSYQGIPLELVKDWSLIQCFWQFVHSPSIGKSVYRSLIEADSRIARIPAGRYLQISHVDGYMTRSHEEDNTEVGSVPEKVKNSDTGSLNEYNDDHKKEKYHKRLVKVENLNHSEIQQEPILTASVLSYGTDDEVLEDEWDFMERPQPPRPSTDDDIIHWLSSGAG